MFYGTFSQGSSSVILPFATIDGVAQTA